MMFVVSTLTMHSKAFVMIRVKGEEIAAEMEHWHLLLQQQLHCVVGPLVHRSNAVVNLGGDVLGVILPSEGSAFSHETFESYTNWRPEFAIKTMEADKRHFMSSRGKYLVHTVDEDSVTEMTAEQVGGWGVAFDVWAAHI